MKKNNTLLKEMNLDVIAIHGWGSDAEINMAKACGIKYLAFDASLKDYKRETVLNVCKELNEKGQKIKDLGMKLTIHNHADEFLWVDGEEGNIGTLFDYFPQWKTMAAAGFLQFAIVGLGFLLFIIPGIVLGLCYAMTPYILAEEPELKAWEAMKRSKEMMNGNKWRFFCLGFSFIGWEILASLVPAIGQLFLMPYINASHAAFYRDVTRPLAGEEDTVFLQETIL